ncbi:MAG: XTP/dITP diphosphatase [Gammaproteobacteria bacterium]|nr:XTP/dITP diphosphatase [Gammaproteobacteria bacterium]
MQQMVLATGNKGKVAEIQAMLVGTGIEVLPQSQFDVPEVDETGLTFVENAILKARQAARISGLPAIADDSGLEVDALGGQPGIYSSRYAGQPGNDAANNAKLLQALQAVADDQRTARFQCVIVFMRHADDPVPFIAQGTWEGRILHAPAGNGGFGYDPLFFVAEEGCASAQLVAGRKNQISHRARALQKLVEFLKR